MLRRLRAPAWAWLLAAIGLLAFASLGTWQARRGLAKQAFLSRIEQASGPVETLGSASSAPAPMAPRRAEARGTYEPEHQLLQDGQSRAGQPGFHVWTPLRLADGGLLLVNRGWIPQPAQLAGIPPPEAPAGELRLQGWWRDVPEPAIHLGDGSCPGAPEFPAVVVYPRQAELECLLAGPVLPGLLLLDAQVPGGFVREWASPGLPPERHFGYAVTWFALGLTTLFLFIKLNWKP